MRKICGFPEQIERGKEEDLPRGSCLSPREGERLFVFFRGARLTDGIFCSKTKNTPTVTRPCSTPGSFPFLCALRHQHASDRGVGRTATGDLGRYQEEGAGRGFRNNGREYRPHGKPQEDRIHDFLTKELRPDSAVLDLRSCRKFRAGERRR